MAIIVFYAWQSDTPANVNRNFIKDALKKAIKNINRDLQVDEPERNEKLELDHDTKGVPGSPGIADTILEKIDNSDLFVGDVTFVGKSAAGKKLPNSNVLLELGYALKALGPKRYIGVMNTAFGEPEKLPFDLAHRRFPIQYRLAPETSRDERRGQLKKLVGQLEHAIRTVVESGNFRKPKAQKYDYALLEPKSRKTSFLNEGDRLATVKPPEDEGEPFDVIWHDGPQMFLRIIPAYPIARLTRHKLVQLMEHHELVPFGDASRLWRVGNEYGAVVFEQKRGTQDTANRITQVSSFGEIWGINGLLLRDQPSIPVLSLETTYKDKLANYLLFASEALGVNPPVKAVAGLTGVLNYQLSIPDSANNPQIVGMCAVDQIIHCVELADFDASPNAFLDNFFSKVWEECQAERSS